MFGSLIYLILAILGLGFLIFIHELGHYLMARHVGMKVESFGIGFGKPFYSFDHHGVKWNICWLPFGGYVKIAGMEQEKGGKDPSEIPDGFFGKSPWQRLKVSLMGPLANLILALLLFSLIWTTGGRQKTFSEVTKKIGWVDPTSQLYRMGIRPGDEILSYNGEKVTSFKDSLQAAMTGGETLKVEALHYEPNKKAAIPVTGDIHPYPPSMAPNRGLLTTGVIAPAAYVIYSKQVNGEPNILPKESPLEGSGILPGDRIAGIDGEKIFSLAQLANILNDGRCLITARRGNEIFLARVPRILVGELKLDPDHREEISDWQWEAHLKDKKFQSLFFIPYNLNSDCVVESTLKFIDPEREKEAFPKLLFSHLEAPLHVGDEIIAVDGMSVLTADKLLKELQTRKVSIVVEDERPYLKKSSWREADCLFDESAKVEDIDALFAGVGQKGKVTQKGDLRLLKPVTPKTRLELFEMMQDKGFRLASELAEEKKAIQTIDDVEKRQEALKLLEQQEKQLLLGLPGVQDLAVQYNPNPLSMFRDVVDEVVSTLSAVIGGALNPKWIAGPLGIVQVMQHQWMVSLKEALFWLGIISLNLGLLNLLPLPILDGGYVALSLFEMASGRRLKAKTIEKIVVPFAILLITFFVFLTYNDIVRIVSNLFHL